MKLGRGDLSRIVVLIKAYDAADGTPDEAGMKLRLIREVELFMRRLQTTGVKIDRDIFTALPDDDSAQTMLLGYCMLIISLVQTPQQPCPPSLPSTESTTPSNPGK